MDPLASNVPDNAAAPAGLRIDAVPAPAVSGGTADVNSSHSRIRNAYAPVVVPTGVMRGVAGLNAYGQMSYVRRSQRLNPHSGEDALPILLLLPELQLIRGLVPFHLLSFPQIPTPPTFRLLLVRLLI
jgi:hypothetical protein